MDNTKILIVEDNAIVAEDLKIKLIDLGYSITGIAYSGEAALESIKVNRPDIALMDINLGDGINGIDTASKLKSEHNISVIYLTAHADDDTISRAKITEPYGYIIKPFDAAELKSVIEIMTYRQQSEQRLIESEKWYKTTLNSIGDGVITTDMDGIITFMNPIAEMLTGWSLADATGEPLEVVFNIINEITRESCGNLVLKVIETGQIMGLANQTLLISRDGKETPIKDSGAPILLNETDKLGVILVFQDETESKIAEKKLKQQEMAHQKNQKLEAIGQLAAGIAHEINTPIQYVGDNTSFINDAFDDLAAVIKNYKELWTAAKDGTIDEKLILKVETLLEEADIDYLMEEVPSAIESTFEGIGRVRKIVEFMKEFSHPGSDEKVMTDIHHSIENTAIVSKNEWKYVADLTMELEPDLPKVFCNPNEINQVFLNLILNAGHAISEKLGPNAQEKGIIKIVTRTSDNWVEIRISDSGTGIPDDIKGRVFDPFFTTKEVGKGTGQGLAIAHSFIVERHNGKIDIETSKGEGSSFIVKLPLDQ